MCQSQSHLIQCLGLFQWALNSPLMGMAEPSLQKGAAAPGALEHKVCRYCTSVWCRGSLGSFLAMQFLLRGAWQPALPGVPLQKLWNQQESLSAFPLLEPCSSLPLAQKHRFICTVETKQRIWIKAVVKAWGYRCLSGQEVSSRTPGSCRRNLTTWFPDLYINCFISFLTENTQHVNWQWPVQYWADVWNTSTHRLWHIWVSRETAVDFYRSCLLCYCNYY